MIVIRHRQSGEVVWYVKAERLAGANLARLALRGASLQGRDLRGTDLRGADLRGAILARADLRGANLRGARLGGAELAGALFDASTRWPLFFSPSLRGCRELPASGEVVPASAPPDRMPSDHLLQPADVPQGGGRSETP
jgi:Pentapeptide repeats (8 copies)